jgi:hypothetical protein
MANRIQLFALPSVPGTVATGAWLTARLTLHDTAAACVIAALAGLLALIGVFVVSPETQKTLRLWIRHRAEHRIAAATSFEIRRRAWAATRGRAWTRASANEIRQAGAKFNVSKVTLSEVMLITRMGQLEKAGITRKAENGPSSREINDDVARVPLEIVQDALEQGSEKSASV